MYRPHLLTLLACGFCAINSHAAQFRVDSRNSTAYFEVGYFGGGLVKGALDHITGAVEYDAASKLGSADINFDISTVETGSNFVNGFIKSRHVFDTAAYPSMQFHADRFEFQGGQLTGVKGDLTLHGVTKPVLMDVKRFVCADVNMAEQARHQCTGNFKTTVVRSNFGMHSFSSIVDDEVRITVDLTLERLQP